MQTVLVTGATSGLAIATTLHERGLTVLGTSRSPEKHQGQVPFKLYTLDITSEASIQACLDALAADAVVLDALVNNAGIAVNGSAEETSSALAHKQLDTNFWGAVNMTKAVLPGMRSRRQGYIITIGSLAGLIGVPFQSYYAASKHALEGFCKSLRLELRPFNIQVSVVEPGFFKSGLTQAYEYADTPLPAYDQARPVALAYLARSVEQAPPPQPVAEAVWQILRTRRPRFSYRVGTEAKLLPLLQLFSPRFYEWGAGRRFGV